MTLYTIRSTGKIYESLVQGPPEPGKQGGGGRVDDDGRDRVLSNLSALHTASSPAQRRKQLIEIR